VDREVIDVTSGQRSNRVWQVEREAIDGLLLCPLVSSIASLSTCQVYCFSVHMSRLLLLCPFVTSIRVDREAIDVTSGQRSNSRDKWPEKKWTWQVDGEEIDLTSGQRSIDVRLLLLCPLVTSITSLSACLVYYFSVHLSRLLLLCPLVTSNTSLSTCHVYYFSVHFSRLLLLCPLVTSIASLSTCYVYYAIDVTSEQRGNIRDKWTEK
jgi:hypothetical protein